MSAGSRRFVICGAAGRDFHNFNVVFRGRRGARVRAVTATQVRVKVRVAEQPLNQVTAGVGVSAKTGPRVTYEHTWRRVFGQSATARNKFEYGRDRQAWQGDVSSRPGPDLFRWFTGGTLERLIGVARYAPSGHNRQPVRWLVVSGREPVHALAGHVVDWMRHFAAEKPAFARRMMLDRIIAGWEAGQDPVGRGAHHLIGTHAPKVDGTAPSACCLALAHLDTHRLSEQPAF